MALQVQKHDRETVIGQIAEWLMLCATGLDISLPPDRLLMMSADVLDAYTYESLEDVRECLKSARRGAYGWGMEKRGTMNMVIVRFWMAEYLELKSIERQARHQASIKEKKLIEQEELPGVDYEAYKIRMSKNDTEWQRMKGKERKNLQKEMEFQAFKEKYLKGKQKADKK